MKRIKDFFVEDDSIAAAVVSGWFSSSKTRLPQGTFGYVLSKGELEGQVFEQGHEMDASGSSAAWIFRAGPWPLEIVLGGVSSKDGIPVQATLEVVVEVTPSSSAVRQFLAGRDWPGRVKAADIAERILGGLQDSFGVRLGKETLAALAKMDAQRARELLTEAGEEAFFERGMAVCSIKSLRIRAPESDELRDRETELSLEEERVRQRLRFIDLWRRQEVGETLARRDVDAMARYLKQEGILKEIEQQGLIDEKKREEDRKARESEQQLRHLLSLRELEHSMEIDARKLDEEIARTRKMSELLRDGGIEAQLFQIKDEALKGRLYRLLLERDMTPEQIRARSAGVTVEDLGELGQTLRELIGSVKLLVEKSEPTSHGVAEVSSASAGSKWRGSLPTVKGRAARRLLVVAGRSVHVVQPSAGAEGAPIVTELPFDDAGLGQLRSVRSSKKEDGFLLLVGAQDGVCTRKVPTAADGVFTPETLRPGDLEVYRFERSSAAARGGANSAAIHGLFLFAAHSERGLVRWARCDGSLPEVLDLPRGSPPTLRGIQIGPGGLAWYAKGQEIVAFDPDAPRHPVRRLLGAGEEIASFAVSPAVVLAGTRKGRLLRWALDGDERPDPFAQLGSHAVYMVRTLRLGDEHFFVVGAGSEYVHLCRESGGHEILFAAPRPVSWVGACGQRVYAIDRRFHVLYVWDRAQPNSQATEVRFAHKVRDLWVDLDPAGHESEVKHGALA